MHWLLKNDVQQVHRCRVQCVSKAPLRQLFAGAHTTALHGAMLFATRVPGVQH